MKLLATQSSSLICASASALQIYCSRATFVCLGGHSFITMTPVCMTLCIRAAMLCLLTISFIKTTVTDAFRVASIPDFIQLAWSNEFDVGKATDVQACLDAAYDANTTFEAISFDSGTGECHYYSDLIATLRRASGEQPNYWVRIDRHMHLSAVTSCLTEQDARYLLMQMAYKDQTCIMNSAFDTATGLCIGSYSNTSYDYQGGRLADGTGYFLFRALAADGANYRCDDEVARKMIFGGTWYCYYYYKLSSSEQAQGENVITGDYCTQRFGSTAHVVKISEPREYEWVYAYRYSPREAVHLGLTLRSGTTYQWYDGTIASDLPWLAEHPKGEPYTLVRIVNDIQGFNVEGTAPPITQLLCKKPATYIAYDACSKFKTCT